MLCVHELINEPIEYESLAVDQLVKVADAALIGKGNGWIMK